MDAANMLARDLVLRVCASDAEFRRGWLSDGTGPKRVVPLAAPPGVDPDLAGAIAGAAAEMGARHLLACRTRAAYMYETVTVLPATPHALLDLAARWGQPDDFLVCLPDRSAAVVVSVAGYALGAGPPEFLAALAGPDVAGTRERFGAWARETGDQRLRLVAGRYAGPSLSRHAPRRKSRPDLPERLWRLGVGIRRWRAVTAALRVGRAAVGWAAVAVIVTTLLSAPRSSHALPALGLAMVLLLQVFALARTHTLGWPAYLRMTAAGAVCAVALAASEWWIAGPRVLRAPAAVPALAEELAKLLPVAIFWAFARHRFTRLAVVDYLMLGVASGAGFALAEGVASALAAPGAGWHVAALLPGWSDAGGIRFPGHAVTTGVITASLGLAVAARAARTDPPRTRLRLWRWLVWLLPPLLLGLAVLDHYHYDAAVAGLRVPPGVARLHTVIGDGHAGRWLLLALLVIAVVVDFRAIRGVADTVPPLPGVSPWAGLARAARGRVIATRLRPPAAAWAARPARWRTGIDASAAETLAAACHELAFLLVTARPRRGTRGLLPASLRFVRQRRELAMRDAHAAGRERRDVPARKAVWAGWRRITDVLGLAGPATAGPTTAGPTTAGAAALVAPAPLALAALAGSGRPGAASRVSHPRIADIANEIPALHTWFDQFIPAGQVLIIGAGISVIILLASGWALPIPLRRRRDETSRDLLLRKVAQVPAPGQAVLGVLRLGGWLLPPRTARLLAGKPAARPYRRDPGARYAVLPSGLIKAIPAGAAGETVLAAPRRPAGGAGSAGLDDLDLSGWMFPPDRVRRWLNHAPEFGVAPTAAEGAQLTTTDLTAHFTGVLREIAEAASSLRFGDISFRNHPGRAVVDRTSGGAVFFTPAGEFTGCAVLTEEQLFLLITERRL
jgi:RsiW-degrading membrane proteinase PrsW (M82 family)